jgi:signal recognition particle GTPase
MPVYRLDENIKLHSIAGKESNQEEMDTTSTRRNIANLANVLSRNKNPQTAGSTTQQKNYLTQTKDKIELSKEAKLIYEVLKIKDYIKSLPEKEKEEKLKEIKSHIDKDLISSDVFQKTAEKLLNSIFFSDSK